MKDLNQEQIFNLSSTFRERGFTFVENVLTNKMSYNIEKSVFRNVGIRS